jgi:hypothetical protein
VCRWHCAAKRSTNRLDAIVPIGPELRRYLPGFTGVASREPDARRVSPRTGPLADPALEVAAELLPRLLPLPGQPSSIPNVPGAQDRRQHLVSVDPQVVDAGHRDLHRAASEALNGVPGIWNVLTTSQMARIVSSGAGSSAAWSAFR